jgi:cytochrome c oxidase subunit IV
MSQRIGHHEAEASRTTHVLSHGSPTKLYLLIYGLLLLLLLVTVGAAHLTIPEPFSFLVALAIAVAKAVLVILFFMHVKDASRVTWVFCGCSFLWLAIMLALTFGDYLTRIPVSKETPLEQASAAPAQAEGSH